MSGPDDNTNLPAPIAAAMAGIPAALMPASIKALDRLIGAAVDIPVALLERVKAKIVSGTEAFLSIDGAITKSAAAKAGVSEQYSNRALDNFVRKSYRQFSNKEAVSAAMIEDLLNSPTEQDKNATQNPDTTGLMIDDDWLNVFERYAEDASTERMQKLWGRVLAGEVRKPGRYGMRTLRFLSEFSQADAHEFSLFCEHTFAGIAPRSLVKIGDDISNLLALEAAGLIQGVSSSLGLQTTLTFDHAGKAFIIEKPLAILFVGSPEASFNTEILSLTPLGKELVGLLPGRDARSAARVVGAAMKRPEAKAAYIMLVDQNDHATPIENLWQDEVLSTGGR